MRTALLTMALIWLNWVPAAPPDSLALMVQYLAGTWADEAYVLGQKAGTWPPDMAPSRSLQLDPAQVEGPEVSIMVAEYCRPGVAEALRFRWAGGRLVYSGATYDGCAIDITRIVYLDLRYQVEGGDTLLIYEVQEVEHGHFVQARLRRLPVPLEPGWQCSLQAPLLQVLTQGYYALYDAHGRLTTLDAVLGLEDAREALAGFDDFLYLWPMLEELCVRNPFEVVVLGSFHPGGVTHILGIEWQAEGIYLYETHPASGDSGDLLPLRRGPRFLTIIPQGQAQPLEDF